MHLMASEWRGRWGRVWQTQEEIQKALATETVRVEGYSLGCPRFYRSLTCEQDMMLPRIFRAIQRERQGLAKMRVRDEMRAMGRRGDAGPRIGFVSPLVTGAENCGESTMCHQLMYKGCHKTQIFLYKQLMQHVLEEKKVRDRTLGFWNNRTLLRERDMRQLDFTLTSENRHIRIPVKRHFAFFHNAKCPQHFELWNQILQESA